MPTDNSSMCLICRLGPLKWSGAYNCVPSGFRKMAKFSIESLLSPRTFCCGPLRSSPPPPPVTEELRPEFDKRINVGAALSKDMLNASSNDNSKLSITANSNFLSSLLASTVTHQMQASAFGLHAPFLPPALLNSAIGPSAFTHIGPQFFGTVFPGPNSHPYSLFAPSHPALLAAAPHYTNGKRKRRHRTIFSEEQLQILETTFLSTRYPDVGVREKLAMQCDLKEERVEVWFKNRRAKERKKSREAVTLSSPILSAAASKGQLNGGANTGSRLTEGSSSSEIDDDEDDAEEGEGKWEGEEAEEVGEENFDTAATPQRAKISESTQVQKCLVAIKRKRVDNPHSAPPKSRKRDNDRSKILKTPSRSTTSTPSPKAASKKEITDGL